MPTSSLKSVTGLPVDLNGTNRQALATMLPLVYDELRAIADRTLRYERPSMEPAALVHETFLRLARQRNVCWERKPHFIGIAVQFMHRILVDHARSRQAAKRRSNRQRVSLEEAAVWAEQSDVELSALKEALTSLAAIDARQSRIVELRYFGGLTVEQCAQDLGVSPATVKREWATAKAWLRREISKD